ncbi:EpsG family protein [Acinetobacter baumannii]|uniref:EpsG family protein n=1 Tax=Acinetobacter baumannii TaxID=470 RepID=UPI00254CA1FE|nr:EpsG family protein [Acinetobacter baumannii]
MTIGLVFSFNIIMLLLCSLFSAAKSSRVFNAVFLIISSIITAVYAVQRDFNYGDTGNYVNFYQFEYIYIKFEPLFDFIARAFIQIFPGDPFYFLFFCAVITSLIFFLAYKKLVGIKSSYFAYWILLSTFSFHYLLFEVIRQGIAVGLLVLGMSYLVKDNNWIKYYICLFLAIGFHYSVAPFLFLPLLFLIKKKYYYFIIFVVVGVLGKFLFMKIGNIIGISDISQKLEIYSGMTSESQTILLRNIMLISITPLVYRISNSKAYFNIYFLYVVMLAMTLGIDEINRRYLFVGPVFLIPVFWNYFKTKRNGSLLLIIYIFMYFYIFLINYWSMYGLLNYKPLFEII